MLLPWPLQVICCWYEEAQAVGIVVTGKLLLVCLPFYLCLVTEIYIVYWKYDLNIVMDADPLTLMLPTQQRSDWPVQMLRRLVWIQLQSCRSSH